MNNKKDLIFHAIFLIIIQIIMNEVFPYTSHSNSHIQEDIMIKTIIKIKVLQISELNFITKRQKVVILKDPFVHDKIFQCQVGLVNFPLDFCHTRKIKNPKFNSLIYRKYRLSCLQSFMTLEL